MSDNSKISQLTPAISPLLGEDDFVIRRGAANFRVSRDELAKSIVTVNNECVLYLCGDEFTDGSIRFIIDEMSGIATIEQREDGVWNLGEFQLAQGSLSLGRDVKLSAVGHNLVVESPGVPGTHLVLSQGYDEQGTDHPEATTLDVLEVRSVFQPDNTTEKVLTVHEQEFTATGVALISGFYLQVGSVGATSEVELLLKEGDDPDKVVFFQKNFPASFFAANTEIRVDMLPGSQFLPGVTLTLCVTTADAFALKYDATSTAPWIATDRQVIGQENILTESLLLANDLGIIFDNDLNLLRGNQVFT